MATDIAHLTRDTSSVVLDEDQLILDRFCERNPQVLTLARESEDLEVLVHDCLAIGARALTAAQATSDVAIVEKAFGEMASSFTLGLDGFSQELEAKTRELLDSEDGILPRSLGEFADRLEELLGDTFDPESKRSAVGILEQVMQKAALEQLKATRALLDPDNEISPLSRYRSEIIKAVEKETEKLRTVVEELKTQLAVEDGKAEIFELTTKKGFVFEDELENRLIAACQPLGDVVERVGGTSGNRGKKGDFQVGLNPDDVAGQDIRYAIEAKNQQLNLRDTLRELDKAIANRDALAAIAVFARPEQCPGDEPFQHYGNRALAVYEPGDESALRLACCWARWVARRQLSAAGDTVDLDRIGALIDDARHALRVQSTIDRALTTSANKIGEAKKHLSVLVTAVETALSSIEGEIAAQGG